MALPQSSLSPTHLVKKAGRLFFPQLPGYSNAKTSGALVS
jgi:hypothetical protein